MHLPHLVNLWDPQKSRQQKLQDCFGVGSARLLMSLERFDINNATPVEQQCGERQMSVAARQLKRCAEIAGLHINRTTASVEQQCGERQMSVATRDVKRCAEIAALLINRTTASVEQQCGERQMPVATREVKRCPAITILAVDRHPRIKVQRAQPHVTFSRRFAQPSLADPTASLTQRFDAEDTGVRHHLQTRSVLQRNDVRGQIILTRSATRK